jgi:hypothetical protein
MAELLPSEDVIPQGTLTRMAKAAGVGVFPDPAIRHVTTVGEIAALLPHVRWNLLSHGLDPFCGMGTIKSTFEDHNLGVRISQNDVDYRVDADMHQDAMQPQVWKGWFSQGDIDFVVTSPPFALLDYLVPLMALFTPVLFVHVPVNWAFSGINRRSSWLRGLRHNGRLRFFVGIPRGMSGMWQTCWLVITESSSTMAQILEDDPCLSESMLLCASSAA